MWIPCGILSVVFCITGWVLAFKKHSGTAWASLASLAFVCLTLLMQYRLVFLWVNKEEWISLLDVAPTMFSILTGYVVIMLLANIIPLLLVRKQK